MGLVSELSPTEAASRRDSDSNVVLLDVREPDELLLARIEGAQHIPMGDIPGRLQHLNPDHTLIVFCHRGKRSYAEVDPRVPRD